MPITVYFTEQMETKIVPDRFGGLPLKTAWAVIWFAILGAVVLIWHREVPGTQTEAETLEEAGATLLRANPLPNWADQRSEIEHGPKRTDIAGYFDHLEPHQAIEDLSGRVMCPFYRALEQLEQGASDDVVRVLHYGDSILTTDELSGRARRVLQQRFGDGGHGFVLLGKPWRWYHHLDVKHGARGKWRPRPLTSDPVRDGLYGLGGVAFETIHPHAAAWVGTAETGPVGNRVASFDISYLMQPRGGSFDIMLDGEVIETVSTRADARHAVHRRLDVTPGKARLMLKTRGNGPVRLFGAVLESGQSGIVYDSLAINGARASIFGRFNKAHWQSEIKRRKASLVVLMLGANEGHNKYLALNEYQQHLSMVLRTIREGAPEAACLLVGPLDQAERKDNGKLGSRRMPRRLSRVQREVSLAEGCAFFDTYQAMGGKNSMARWFREGLGGGDFVHPTEQGARQIGSWLADALLAGYERFLWSDEQCVLSVTSL